MTNGMRRKHKPPTIVRFIKIAKHYVEHHWNLTLGDTVNVALFGLTIISLVLGLGAIIVAWTAYLDAHNGGEAQKQSLTEASTLLDTETQKLSEINGQITRSIAIAERQQDIFNRSLLVSSEELANLQRQTTLASRSPRVALDISCGPGPDPGDLEPYPYDYRVSIGQSLLEWNGLHGRKIPPLSGRLNQIIRTDYSGRIQCDLALVNKGDANLTGAFVRVFLGWSEFEGKISYLIQDSDNEPASVLSTNYQDDVDDNFKSAKPEQFNELIKGKTVFASSRSEDIQTKARFILLVPRRVKFLIVGWEFGGDQQAGSHLVDYFAIDHMREMENDKATEKLIKDGTLPESFRPKNPETNAPPFQP